MTINTHTRNLSARSNHSIRKSNEELIVEDLFDPFAKTDEKISGAKESDEVDLEAQMLPEPIPKPTTNSSASPSLFRRLEESSLLQTILAYPAPHTLKLKPTSWLDGVRGVAALEVFIFHALGPWANLVPAYNSSLTSTNILQLPFIRSFFVTGGTAVSLFFPLSGYVLTHKSLYWIRQQSPQKVYPSVISSFSRRGFRLYLPVIILTFCEMLGTRLGFVPALNFSFVAEKTLSAQFKDWVCETNHLINPFYNAQRAILGMVTHPKYETVVWTIPLEYYGSIFCYVLLIALAKVPSNKVRMSIVAFLALLAMCLGSWNMFCFASGMLIADFNLSQDESSSLRYQKVWTVLAIVSFYVAGFPTLLGNAVSEPMTGFSTLLHLLPKLPMENLSRFWWSLSGIGLLLSISQLCALKHVFESNFCQYLGKISFSLYLVHESCIVMFGLRLQNVLLGLIGIVKEEGGALFWGICVLWFMVLSLPVFAIAARVERWIDRPSVEFARVVEARGKELWKKFR